MTMYDNDNRRVVLIKSLTTNNRFYALVAPERGIRNADMVETIPEDLILGIAYPCLEDGLNDFAVIRTTFETLDLFPEDDPIRDEMMEIIHDARDNLMRRLHELHDKIAFNKAHFLGTDYNEFKSYALDIVRRGYPRRNLDSMMKLNVFSSVAQAEGFSDSNDLLYRFEFGYTEVERVASLEARAFIVALFQEVIDSVKDDNNYKTKYLFDRNVFQKFIAVMFVNYATTDPMFYGINRRDYGVSGDKDMEDTPLYIAVRREIKDIENQLAKGHFNTPASTSVAVVSVPSTPHLPPPAALEPHFTSSPAEEGFILPSLPAETVAPGDLVGEELLLGTITSLCSAASLLLHKSDTETQRFAQIILAEASQIVKELKRQGLISPLANDPGDCAP